MRPGAFTIAILVAGLAGCQRERLASTPVDILAVASAAQSADPALAVDPASGDVLAAWIGGDGKVWTLYFSRSSDAGSTWSPATSVAGGPAAPGELHPHGESAPKLVAGPRGMVAIAWPNRIVVSGRKYPAAMMRFTRSADGGKTWSAAITLNDDTTGAPTSHQFHGAAWTGDSGLVVAWLDERGRTPENESDATIYLASSPDFGASWRENTKGWGAVCPCCKISLARRQDGEVVAAWRQHFAGDIRDVVTAKLTPAAGEAARVHADNWVYPGCPHTGPAIATGAGGMSHVVWYTGKPDRAGVFYAKIDSTGATRLRAPLVTGAKLPPAHASIAALADGGAVVAYDLDEKGMRAISVTRISPDGKPEITRLIPASSEGKYPQIAVLGDTTAIVAWTTTEGDTSRVLAARVHLN